MKNRLIFLTVIFMSLTMSSQANIDLTQCSLNNNNAMCNQTQQKINQIKKIQLKHKQQLKKIKKANQMSVTTFFSGLISMVKDYMQSKSKNKIQIKTTFESDTYSSSVVVRDYDHINLTNHKFYIVQP